ncbi:MAG: ABC transporter permease [Euryarchaeota archaeon]|nr:ABC transporter permease [Euryarchaeota archaeon]
MLRRLVATSLRHRARLYLPMVLAVALSLALAGTALTVGESFAYIVEEKMEMYGANVILTEVDEVPAGGVAVELRSAELEGSEVVVAVADVEALLAMNPAWLVRGTGDVLAGAEVAERLGIAPGDRVELAGDERVVAVLESGTEFDSYLVVNGTPGEVDMVLLRTEEPERYRGKGVVLEEMLRAKYAFLEGVESLLAQVSAVTLVTALLGALNLARMDAGTRRREFGILRAMGAGRRTLGWLVLSEYLALALLTGAVALVATLVMSSAVLQATAGTAPVMDAGIPLMLVLFSLLSFLVVGAAYLGELRRQEVAEELRGE